MPIYQLITQTTYEFWADSAEDAISMVNIGSPLIDEGIDSEQCISLTHESGIEIKNYTNGA